MNLQIIILNFRTADVTLACLTSLANVLDEVPDTRVLLIDNGSGDDSVEKLSAAISTNRWEGWCELMPLQSNVGFAAGNNRGIEKLAGIECSWVLLLNSDTVVHPGALQRSLEVMQADPKIGMMSCRLLNADGSTQNCTRPFPSPFRLVLCAFGLPWIFPRLFGWADVYDMPKAMLDQKRDCGWIIGAYMFIRRAAIDAVGGFDEEFFFYGEDIELCHRFHSAGWRIHYDPGASITHLGGASSDASRLTSGRRDEHVERARYLVQKKCFGAVAAWVVGSAFAIADRVRRFKCGSLFSGVPEGQVLFPDAKACPFGTPLNREKTALVAIGRNEGERLRRCLMTAGDQSKRIVYVDSGSTDGSAALAKSLGAEVVELDLSIPFTAARARNAGFERLLSTWPDVDFVQFIDGDCELSDSWLDIAATFLRDHPEFAIAGGRVRERFPNASIYNRLCDMEWQTPVGETHWCGGNILMRATAFKESGGFNPTFIAGEEPELCVRLRDNGWRIYRLDADVAMHDAEMHHFTQWWRRAVRNGYSFAEGAKVHGYRPERYWVRQVRSGWVWGIMLPIVALVAAWPTRGGSLVAAVFCYGMLFAKVLLNKRNMIYSMFVVIGKFPQAIGQLRYVMTHLRGKRARLIEYRTQTQ